MQRLEKRRPDIWYEKNYWAKLEALKALKAAVKYTI